MMDGIFVPGPIEPITNRGRSGVANSAAASLLELFSALLGSSDGLLSVLAQEAERVGRTDPGVIVANGIGFLSQGYESTAGLIGNTLLALAAHPDLYDWVQAEPRRVRGVVREVLRYDSPVQNTRRTGMVVRRSGTAELEEFGMRSPFNNAPTFQNKNLVRAQNGR